ncbi:MAG: hypothetical protein ABIK09_16320 [Pseudomonadota bacterium]
MARKNTGRILAEELHRILEEFKDLDEEIGMLLEERKRLATLAHKLLQILRTVTSQRVADRLIEELGLADLLAKLPGVPGRKHAAPVKVKRVKRQQPAAAPEPVTKAAAPAPVRAKKATPAEVPAVLEKGTGVRMLAGKYTDWAGIVRSIIVKGSRVTYAVTLRGADGKSARTQVTPRSMGKKWVVDATVVPPKKRKVRKTKRKGASKKKAAGKSKAK